MEIFKEIYEYRQMIFSLVHRELRGRYKGTALGFLWSFLNPLFQIMVYTIVFSIIMRTSYEKYYLFLFIALIPWIYFNTSLLGGAGCISSQKNLVNKIYFPREVLPIAHVLGQLVNMMLSMVVVVAVIIFSRHGFNMEAILYFPLIVLLETILALGLTFITSAITVYMRDIEYILGIVMMAWQFLSPVMYDVDMVPDKYKTIFNLNPMSSILVAYRDIFYYKRVPELKTLTEAFLLGVFFLVFGFLLFEKLKKKFSEEM